MEDSSLEGKNVGWEEIGPQTSVNNEYTAVIIIIIITLFGP